MSDPRLKPFLVIFGPTAVGKTSAAMQVCRAVGGEIISADSMQVYRGFDIGTAKHRDQDSAVPQHLIDMCAPEDIFSAADFVKRTLGLVSEIEGRGCLPVVVGGSGLYIRTLLDGIFEGPPRDPGIRARLRQEALLVNLISHRDIVAIFDFGEVPSDGRRPAFAYIVMEYLEGESLRDRLLGKVGPGGEPTTRVGERWWRALRIMMNGTIVPRTTT